MKRVLVILMIAGILAAGVDFEIAEAIARTRINSFGQEFAVSSVEDLENIFVFRTAPTGYVIVTKSMDLPPVLAYSNKTDLSSDAPMLDIAQMDARARLDVVHETDQSVLQQNRNLWDRYIAGEGPTGALEVYGPYLDTHWNQDGPYWNYCPDDPETGERCYTGCVATAVAQLLNYYEWPEKMHFDEFDTYRVMRERDFEVSGLGLSMEDINYNEDGSDMSSENIAHYIRACGQALNMAYSSDGSAALSFDYDFMNEFGFGYVRDISGDDSTFLSQMAQSIIDGNPAVLDIWERTAGHEIVVDGFNTEDSTFHFNMGWGGSSDGWYSLPDGMPAGFTLLFYVNIDFRLPEYNAFHVPEDFSTIQSAFDAALSGDTIYIASGVYTGEGNRDLDPCGKSLNLIGAGVDSTYIDLGGSTAEEHRAFHLTKQERLVVKGMTIMNGYAEKGGAVYSWLAEPIFQDVRFESCSANEGGVFYGGITNPQFISVEMVGNTAEFGGAVYISSELYKVHIYDVQPVLFLKRSIPVFINCTISDNFASQYGGALFLGKDVSVFAANTLFNRNRAVLGADFVASSAGNSSVYLKNSIIPQDQAISADLHFDRVFTADSVDVSSPLSLALNSGSAVLPVPFMDEYTFTAPLYDITGSFREGQPDIGAREYTITPDNRPPTIPFTRWYANLGDTVRIPLNVCDPDEDPVDITLIGEGDLAGDTLVFPAVSPGTYFVNFLLSDGTESTMAFLDIIVLNQISGRFSGTLTETHSPCYVVDNVNILEGDTLLIDGCVTLKLNPFTSINVQAGGVMIVRGEMDCPVVITASDTVFGHGGLSVTGKNTRLEIENAVLEYGKPQFSGIEHNGGLIRCYSSNLMRIADTEFRKSSADIGGAVYVADRSVVSIDRANFADNEATDCGGGLYLTNSTFELDNSAFERNSAPMAAGLMVQGHYGTDVVLHTGLAFRENVADSAAAVYLYRHSANFVGLVMEDNIAYDGAVFSADSTIVAFSEFLIQNNTGEGLIDVDCGMFSLTIGEVFGNDISTVFDMDTCILSVDRVLVDDNSGLAYSLNNCDATFENCIVARNHRPFDISAGIFKMCNITAYINEDEELLSLSGGTKGAVVNSVIWDVDATISCEDCSLYVSNCIMPDMDFEGYSEGSYVRNVNPLLSSELEPLEFSPVIDEGLNVFSTYIGSIVAPNLDYYGNRRPRGSFRWDIGAVESEMSPVHEIMPEELGLSAYPNPFNAAVNLDGEKGQRVSIFDNSGRLVCDGVMPMTWSPAGLSSGIYRAVTDSGEENLIYLK